MVYGVWINEDDGNVDWQQMKEKGIGFAVLRAGYGSGSIDVQFRKNAEICSRLGILCGAYWLSYAYTIDGACQEAEFFLETVEEFKFSLPLYVKYDDGSRRYAASRGVRISEEFAGKMVKAFSRKIEEAGYKSAYYLDVNG